MSQIYIIFLITILVGLFIAGSSFSRLVKVYNKYNTTAYVNITAGQFVAAAFDHLKLPDYRIAVSKTSFSDAYVPSKKIVILSKQNFYSKTVSSIAVAAHEVGHIMQYQSGSGLFAIGQLFRKISKLADYLLFPSLLGGGILLLFFNEYATLGSALFLIGALLYISTFILKIVTIPLEMDASKRALELLKSERILDADELKGAKKVLRAAGLTYVGSIFHNLLRLIRGIFRSFS